MLFSFQSYIFCPLFFVLVLFVICVFAIFELFFLQSHLHLLSKYVFLIFIWRVEPNYELFIFRVLREISTEIAVHLMLAIQHWHFPTAHHHQLHQLKTNGKFHLFILFIHYHAQYTLYVIRTRSSLGPTQKISVFNIYLSFALSLSLCVGFGLAHNVATIKKKPTKISHMKTSFHNLNAIVVSPFEFIFNSWKIFIECRRVTFFCPAPNSKHSGLHRCKFQVAWRMNG